MHMHSQRTGDDLVAVPVGHRRDDVRSGPARLIAQRQASPEMVEGLQRSVGNDAVVQLLRDEEESGSRSPVLDVIGQGGHSLDGTTRAGMERALGADLSGVRVHTDGAAAASAQAVQAHAYTVGDDVVFGSGQYQPETATGQRMLAHELTHVVQQRSGPVDGTPTGTGVSVSDPSDPFERAAEASADRVMSGSVAETAAGGGAAGGESVQREDDPAEEEEPVQGAWVQREAGPEEEEEPATV
jgi:Domain of unknown function (DUF4157)